MTRAKRLLLFPLLAAGLANLERDLRLDLTSGRNGADSSTALAVDSRAASRSTSEAPVQRSEVGAPRLRAETKSPLGCQVRDSTAPSSG
jgi:hypothetical protein